MGFRHPFHKLTDTGACAGHSLKEEGLAFKDVSVCILAEVLSGIVKKFGRWNAAVLCKDIFSCLNSSDGHCQGGTIASHSWTLPSPFLGETDVMIHLCMRQCSCFPAVLCLSTGGGSLFSLPLGSLLAVPCRAEYNLAYGRDLESVCLLFYSFQGLPAILWEAWKKLKRYSILKLVSAKVLF